MKKSVTALCCAVVVVALVFATIGIYYQNSSGKIQFEQSEPYFSDRVVNIISDDESAVPIESKLDKNTSKIIINESMEDTVQDYEIVVINGDWILKQNSETLRDSVQKMLLSGNPVIIIPDEAGVLYNILKETGKSLGFMVFDE